MYEKKFTIKKIPTKMEEIILKQQNNHYIISVNSDCLRALDLSKVDFSLVDVRGIDFTGTNAKVNPRLVYKRDISNTNFAGLDMSAYSFRGVKMENTNLDNTNARLHGNITTAKINGCYLNGEKIIEPKIYSAKRLKKTLAKK